MTTRKTFLDRDSALAVAIDETHKHDSPALLESLTAAAEPAPMVIPKTLGPGDDDGQARGAAAAAGGPLGPGADEPRAIDRGQAAAVRGPLQPGEADPNDRENRNIRMLAQPAASAGDTYAPRRLTVFSNDQKE